MENKDRSDCLADKVSLDDMARYQASCSNNLYESFNSKLDYSLNSGCVEEAKQKREQLQDYYQQCSQNQLTPYEQDGINMFLDTYDTNYILDLPEPKKNILRSRVNSVLQKLIDNIGQNPINEPNFIEGPITYTHYIVRREGEYPKNIRLYGELHNRRFAAQVRYSCKKYGKKPSIGFVELMKKLSTDSNFFFDLFIESASFDKTVLDERFLNRMPFGFNDPKAKRTKTTSWLLERLETTFQDCFHPVARDPSKQSDDSEDIPVEDSDIGEYDMVFNEFGEEEDLTTFNEYKSQGRSREKASCDLVRQHFIDIRVVYSNIDPADMEDIYYLSYLNNKDSLLDMLGVPQIKSLLNKLIKGGRITTQNVMDLFNESRFLTKQLEKTIPVYREKIIEFFNMKINQYLSKYLGPLTVADIITNSIKEILVSPTDSKDLEIYYTIVTLTSNFFKINACIMDMYFLCRLFKRHKHKAPLTKQPPISTNVFVYAGDFHVFHYSEFFEYINGKDSIDVETVFKYRPRLVAESIEPSAEYYIGELPRCVATENTEVWDNFLQRNKFIQNFETGEIPSFGLISFDGPSEFQRDFPSFGLPKLDESNVPSLPSFE